jgi:hypothetical protein
MPYMISEADEVPSPPQNTQSRPVFLERSQTSASSVSATASDMTGRPPTALREQVGGADVNKDLPALPAYLVPSPLFSPRDNDGPSTEDFPEFEDQQNKDFFMDWSFKQSRFSAWSIDDDLIADYAEFSSDNGDGVREDADDDNSLTYSSAQTSGQASPLVYSQQSREAAFETSDWATRSSTYSSNDENEYEGGEKLLPSPPDDASMAQRKSEHDKRHMTTWDDLFEDFHHLGVAV